MGLRQILGKYSGGGESDWTFVAKFIRDQYIRNSSEMRRIADARKRDDYYEGGGDIHVVRLIEKAFSDSLTRKLRTDLVSFTKWNNVIRRVAHETATVYSEPAKRYISTDDERYQHFVEAVNLDATMREVDQKLVYHEDVWVQYRVRKDTKEPVIDVVSPAKFWAVSHPEDPTLLVAIIVDQQPTGPASGKAAHYRVWSADETYQLDAECGVIQTSHEELKLGRLPGVLATVRPPSTKGKLLADCPAADLVAAHETVWFQNVLLLKESKSANKQTYASGDTSAAAMGQSSDTERETFLPEGVTMTAIDRGMDLGQFRDNADHILERAAANHGLPPSVLHHQDSSSGQEIHLRRIPIRENRRRRIPFLRRLERELAAIQSAINANDLTEYAFSAEGWMVDFGEVQQPLTEAEQDAVFEHRRRLGLTDTIEEIRRRNPDLKTDAAAEQELLEHVEIETKRIEMMRNLMAMSGAMGSAAPSATDQPQGSTEPPPEDVQPNIDG